MKNVMCSKRSKLEHANLFEKSIITKIIYIYIFRSPRTSFNVKFYYRAFKGCVCKTLFTWAHDGRTRIGSVSSIQARKPFLTFTLPNIARVMFLRGFRGFMILLRK